jgi:hypothetical protein
LLSLKVCVDLLFICMNACLFEFEHRLELKSHAVAFRLILGVFSEYTSVFRRIFGLGWAGNFRGWFVSDVTMKDDV